MLAVPTIGERIRTWREARDWTQRSLARQSAWRGDDAARIARALAEVARKAGDAR